MGIAAAVLLAACGSASKAVSVPPDTTAPGTTVASTPTTVTAPTTTLPESTTTAPAGGSGPAPVGKVFDVTTFGADPTGQRDSTVAIRKAIAGAEAGAVTTTIYFPAGRYLLDDLAISGTSLPIRSSHPVDVLGAGMADTTVVEKVGTVAYPDLKRGKTVFGLFADGSYFSGLTVDAQTYNAGDALDDSANDTTVEDSRFLGSTNGTGTPVDPLNTFDLRIAATCNVNPGHKGYGIYHSGNVVEDVVLDGHGAGGNDDLDFSCQRDGRISGITDTGWGTAIYIDRAVTVSDYNFTPGTSKADRGFYVTDSSGITITNFTTSGYGGVIDNKVLVRDDQPTSVTIDHEVMTLPGFSLVVMDTKNTTIDNSSLQILKLDATLGISGLTLTQSTYASLSCSKSAVITDLSGLAC
jgi:hypothetical protein